MTNNIELLKTGILIRQDAGKKEIKAKAKDLATVIVGSDEDVVAIDSYLRRIELFTKEIRDNEDFKAMIFKEVESYRELVTKNGIEYEIVTTGTSYDYSHDDVWSSLKSALVERETLLKKHMGTHFIEERVDDSTGEVTTVKVFGAVKKAGQSVKGSIK